MQIKMKCWDEEIEIEVSRDGTITFYDYDPEYDQAMAEFHGGDHSVCYSIWSEWDNKPYVVIDYWLCPDKRFRNLLALDMVARFHKSSLFEQIYSKDANDDAVAKHQALVSNYIDVIREAIDQDLSYPKSGSPSSIVRQIYNANDDIFPRDSRSNRPLSSSYGENYAFGYFMDALDDVYRYESFNKGMRSGVIDNVVSMIASATAHVVAKKHGSEFKRVYSSEVDWFVRRFVDVFEAHEAGEPWPPLEVTS